jgi:tetratricopeptide (TPR) repeat protein
MIGKTETDISVEGSDGATVVGRDLNGVPIQVFIEEMRRKDSRIDEWVAEKEALSKQVSELEKAALAREIDDLRSQKAGLAQRIADPVTAFKEHKARETRIEALLEDQATQMAIGENRIRSALVAFSELNYAEIDALLEETERRGLTMAAKAAFARGLVAEDAIKWTDAARHYARAAQLDPTGESLHKAAYLADLSGNLPQAERLTKEYLDFARTSGDLVLLSVALDRWGAILRQLGLYDQAEVAYDEALEIIRDTLSEQHPNFGASLSNLGYVVQLQGRYQEAAQLYRDALNIARATVGKRHPDYGARLNNLAEVVRLTRDYREAEALSVQSLEITRATFGDQHPFTAISLGGLAKAVQAQGRYTEAEGLMREAMDIHRVTLGENHPDYAMDVGNLGRFLAEAGRRDEARVLLQQALRIFQSALPRNHPHITETERALAALGAA